MSHRYDGGTEALQGIDLVLEGDRATFLLGPNGCGKSTLLRVLSGLLHPSAGRATLGTTGIESLAPRVRARQLAFVPQALESIPTVDVETFVFGGRYAHGRPLAGIDPGDRQAVEAALEATGCHSLRTRHLRELSQGQRQRVLLARALAQESQWILLDEPTSALDVEAQIELLDLVSEIAQQGRGILLVTHDLNLASQYADEVLLMRDGRIAARGGVLETLTHQVLNPLYGKHLAFGSFASGRPWILPVRHTP